MRQEDHGRDVQERVLQGHAVAPGIGIAPLYVVARGFSAPEVYPIKNVEAEKERFRVAIARTKKQIEAMREHIVSVSGESDGGIFDAHLMMLEDPEIIDYVDKAIEERRQNAEFSLYAVTQNHLEAIRSLPDPYLRERTADIEDVCQRLLRNFKDAEEKPSRPKERHILVSYDVHPSDTATMNHQSLCGFATEMGSAYSHAAILARSLGIPAIVGLVNVVTSLRALSPAIIDGYSGKLIINPTPETLEYYKKLRKEKAQEQEASDERAKGKASATKDGHQVTISANIEFAEEIELVKKSGARGIGLYRSEFLLLTGEKMPNETEQALVYSRLVEELAPERLIIRTLDAGGDKLRVEPLPEAEPNPFLGWRGIRISLDRPELFKQQLRAILRASAKGKMALMFPLVSGIEELRQAKRYLQEAMEELEKENVPFDENLETGVMIELPSAAMIADLLAKEVDFFSIGTNDLTQYTIAVDRVNNQVLKLYQPAHPAVLRLIHRVSQAAKEQGIHVAMCGEIAGDLLYTPLVLGLGIEELSVSPHIVRTVRQAINALPYQECRDLVNESMQLATAKEILHLTQSMAEKYYPEIFEVAVSSKSAAI